MGSSQIHDVTYKVKVRYNLSSGLDISNDVIDVAEISKSWCTKSVYVSHVAHVGVSYMSSQHGAWP
jgi:hypothetical protein